MRNWNNPVLRDESQSRFQAYNILDGGAPYYACYATADDQWMALGAIEAIATHDPAMLEPLANALAPLR